MSKQAKIKGGPLDDVLVGTEDDDKISGRGGNDQIRGGLAGNDWLKGNDGDDRLFGGPGDDRMFGGKGNDYMEDTQGSNVFFGGDGHDTMRSFSVTGTPVPTMLVHAGAGDDEIFADSVERLFVWGGDGNDWVTARPTLSATIFGGEGNDGIALVRGVGLSGTVTIDAGPGDDFVWSSPNGGQHIVTLGPGKDDVLLGDSAENGLVITDFEPGANGELLDLSGERPAFSPLFGWLLGEHPPRPDPFDSGYLRLLQSGPDALLQLDFNGPDNGENFATIVTLQNVDAQAMTSENFRYPAPVGVLGSLSEADTESLDITAVTTASSALPSDIFSGGSAPESVVLGAGAVDSGAAVMASTNYFMQYVEQLIVSANTALM